jgi:hypothetical protein
MDREFDASQCILPKARRCPGGLRIKASAGLQHSRSGRQESQSSIEAFRTTSRTADASLVFSCVGPRGRGRGALIACDAAIGLGQPDETGSRRREIAEEGTVWIFRSQP